MVIYGWGGLITPAVQRVDKTLLHIKYHLFATLSFMVLAKQEQHEVTVANIWFLI